MSRDGYGCLGFRDERDRPDADEVFVSLYVELVVQEDDRTS